MKYRVLGPLEVFDGSRPVRLNQAKERQLLGILLVNANRVVSADRLLEDIWGDGQPSSGLKALQYHVSKLRDLLNPDRAGPGGSVLKTSAPGYMLEVGEDELDSESFARLVDEGRAALSANPAVARAAFHDALELWRGTAFADFAFHGFARSEIARLEEERVRATELFLEAELALDRHGDAIPQLTSLVAEHPYREALRGLLITALYRAGRQAEALRTYQDMRSLLGDELGIEPSPELAALEIQVLLQADSLRLVKPTTQPQFAKSNLPTLLTSFVGRVEEATKIRGFLDGGRLVTILGSGGAGKTRLAIEVAGSVAASYADGVRFVDLASVEQEMFVDQAVFDAVEAEEHVDQTLREALTGHLANRSVLLVLDNCEHVLVAAASIAAHLNAHAPGVTVLATSQHVLRLPGERAFPLPPLTAATSTDPASILESDASRLFIERAETARPGYTATSDDGEAIVAITSQLDGIPLAIELAAARMRMMSVSDIAKHLSSRFRLLTDGSREVTRQETLEAAVAWSYDLTQEPERQFFNYVSVFVGSFSHDAAGEVAKLDDPLEVFELLGRLVDKSLIVVDASGEDIRYRLLETLRIFGSVQLVERAEFEETADRHASYYLNLVRDGSQLLRGPQQGMWQRRYRDAAPDIRKMLARLIEYRPEDSLTAVVGLSRYWIREAANQEGAGWLQRALDAADPTPSSARAYALAFLAGLSRWAGSDNREGIGAEAAAMARKVGAPIALSQALNELGIDCVEDNRLLEAISHFEEAVALQSDGSSRAINIMWNIGVAYLDLADVEQADKVAARFAGHPDSLADPIGSAATANLLWCDIAIVRGDLHDARKLAADALETYLSTDSHLDVAHVHDRLAEIHLIEGDLDAAAPHIEASAELLADVSDEHSSGTNLIVARMALSRGDGPSAVAALRLALPVALERPQPTIVSKLLHLTSRLMFLSGDSIAASELNMALHQLSEKPNVTVQRSMLDEAAQLRLTLADNADIDAYSPKESTRREFSLVEALDLVGRSLETNG